MTIGQFGTVILNRYYMGFVMARISTYTIHATKYVSVIKCAQIY